MLMGKTNIGAVILQADLLRKVTLEMLAACTEQLQNCPLEELLID